MVKRGAGWQPPVIQKRKEINRLLVSSLFHLSLISSLYFKLLNHRQKRPKLKKSLVESFISVDRYTVICLWMIIDQH